VVFDASGNALPGTIEERLSQQRVCGSQAVGVFIGREKLGEPRMAWSPTAKLGGFNSAMVLHRRQTYLDLAGNGLECMGEYQHDRNLYCGYAGRAYGLLNLLQSTQVKIGFISGPRTLTKGGR